VIAIVDYGVGNVHSVERALAHAGAYPQLTADPDQLDDADGIVLPGVGAFGPALEKLTAAGMGRRVVELAHRGTPILGVCLG
jgi:imidazole glycerol-phosphate synthase subunit HisH